jgi:hypothetical protein
VIDLSTGSSTWQHQFPLDSLAQLPSAYRLIAFVTKDGQDVQPILNAAQQDLP